MVRELAELFDQQVSVLGGAWGTMVQNLTRPDIALRTRRHHLHPNVLAVATGIADHNGHAKTFIESASRKKP
jgi:hypothetical protein